jgi:hypothetical protein
MVGFPTVVKSIMGFLVLCSLICGEAVKSKPEIWKTGPVEISLLE